MLEKGLRYLISTQNTNWKVENTKIQIFSIKSKHKGQSTTLTNKNSNKI